MILKDQRIRKVLDLVSLSAIDLENLSHTLSSKEILKLDPHEIGLVVVFRDFIKAQKLGLRGDFSSITFKEFNKFWSKQSISKRESSENALTDLPHYTML